MSIYPIVSGGGSGGVSDDILAGDTGLNEMYLMTAKGITGKNASDDGKNSSTRQLDFYQLNNYGNIMAKYYFADGSNGGQRDWWLRAANKNRRTVIYVYIWGRLLGREQFFRLICAA